MSTSITREDICSLLAIPFSQEQLDAICAPLTPCVIIAGAGTGKTTVMAARVVWLVANGMVSAHRVLGLTFTRKAAGELADRIRAALIRAQLRTEISDEAGEQVGTYDSFASSLLREFGMRIGLEREVELLSEAAQFELAHQVVRDYRGDLGSLVQFTPATITKRLISLDEQLQSHLVPINTVRAHCQTTYEDFSRAPLNRRGNVFADVVKAQNATMQRLCLLDLVAAYREAKHHRGVVTYADQLARAVEITTTNSTVPAMVCGRFDVVLLDEYQDTSAAQVRLLKNLFGAGPGQGVPVTAVGDPYQAIYGWRGASATNITEFATTFLGPGGLPAKQYSLSTNRRSDSAILDAGNAVAATLSMGSESRELKAPDGAERGEVLVRGYTTLSEELDALVDEIIEVHTSGVQWREIAVLTRANEMVAEVFQRLRDRDVPAEIVGLGGLIHLPEIAPVVALMRILVDAASNPDVVTLLTGPRWRLGTSDLAALGSRAVELVSQRETSAEPEPEGIEDLHDQLASLVKPNSAAAQPALLDAIFDPGTRLSQQGTQRVRELATIVEDLRCHSELPVLDLIRRAITALGVDVETELVHDRRQLDEFMRHLDEFTGGSSDSLPAVVAWLDLEDEYGSGLEQAAITAGDCVQLLTAHRSKGLEWDVVFLPAMCQGVFPSTPQDGTWPHNAKSLPSDLRSDADGVPQLKEATHAGLAELKDAVQSEHEAAEARLGYVALTRARHKLVLSTHIWAPALKNPRLPSRFVSQVAPGFLQDRPDDDETNPLAADTASTSWPCAEPPAPEKLMAAALVQQAREIQQNDPERVEQWIWGGQLASQDSAETIAGWDRDAAALMTQPTAKRQVEIPHGLSATMLMHLNKNPDSFAEQLIRPMPHKPSQSATRGSHFHAWVQRRFELPGTFEELTSAPETAELSSLIEAFEAGRFADLAPLGVEVPFLMKRGNHILRGRIDAAYAWDSQPYREVVVDWKTTSAPQDPLQLAVYRLAWMQARGLAEDEVGAAFYHVLQDNLVFIDIPTTAVDDALRGI